jgi:hypothetical protein
LRFNQLFKINFINISKFKRELKRLSKTNCTPENYTENEIFDKFNEFLNNGAVVIKNYFSEKKMNAFLNKYHLEIERLRNLDRDTERPSILNCSIFARKLVRYTLSLIS